VKVSAVIPAYNAGPKLRRLLLSLTWSHLESIDSLEVVVVDDGSTDSTDAVVKAFAEDLDLVYVFLPRTPASGRAAARNAGIGKASGEVVVLVDADQICAPDFIAEHIGYHRLRQDLVVAGPRRDLAEGSFDDAALANGFDHSAIPEVVAPDGREKVLTEFSWNFNNLETCWHHLFSCNASVRREHLLAVGGFDEGFIGWGLEDSELGYRLRRAGLGFAFNPAALAYQTGRGVTPEMFAEWRHNLTYFADKHGHAAEVVVQSVIIRVFDPADRSLDWLDAMRRLEFAARALAGRLPEPTVFEWVEVDDHTEAEVLAGVTERASRQDLIIIDDSVGAVLSGPVQCVDTPRDVLYFHRPAEDVRAGLRERYRLSRVASDPRTPSVDR
jgi:glycosyltransferase involved in cell wall biosynthesis